jgi:hypothetical protein
MFILFFYPTRLYSTNYFPVRGTILFRPTAKNYYAVVSSIHLIVFYFFKLFCVRFSATRSTLYRQPVQFVNCVFHCSARQATNRMTVQLPCLHVACLHAYRLSMKYRNVDVLK